MNKVNFSEGPPLIVQVTHPSLLYQLGFLVSSVAKRDAVGRKPKRKLFANEGLAAWERDKDQEISGMLRPNVCFSLHLDIAQFRCGLAQATLKRSNNASRVLRVIYYAS